MAADPEAPPAIVFKKKKKKGTTRRKAAEINDDLNEEPSVQDVLQEAREAQSFRKRNQGVSAIGLATGEKISAEEETELSATGWSLAKGGIMPKNKAKDRDRDREDDNAVTDLNKAFMGTQDIDWEDAQMKKYVEEQIRLGHGVKDKVEEITDYEKRQMDLYKVPEDLRRLQEVKNDSRLPERGILSNAILSGIPEVDLGIDERIKNVEQTEAALLQKTTGGTKRKASNDFDKKYVKPADGNMNYGRARFSRGVKPNAPQGAVHVQGSELVDHKIVFEQALKKGFDRGVTDNIQVKHKDVLMTGHSKQKTNHDFASDDMAFDKFKKRTRKH